MNSQQQYQNWSNWQVTGPSAIVVARYQKTTSQLNGGARSCLTYTEVCHESTVRYSSNQCTLLVYIRDQDVIRILGLALYGSLAASTRYRLLQYSKGFRENGIKLEVRSLLENDYLSSQFAGRKLPLKSMLRSSLNRLYHLGIQRRYDCAILYCELFPFLPGLIESRLLTIPYIYDFDDAFYQKYFSAGSQLTNLLLARKFEPVIARASAVTAGNEHLVNFAARHNSSVTFLPTVVDLARYKVIDDLKESSCLNIGWIGSPSTAPFLKGVETALNAIGKEGPVRLIVIGGTAPDIPNVEIVEYRWTEDTEIEHINTFDIGIMPLPDNEWSRGKCAFKLIQYMACGVPVIGSAIGANLDVVESNCGFLASTTDDWIHAFRRLRDDPGLRKKMGENARRRIQSHYSLDKYKDVFADIIKSVVKH
jgi:glycosyltransferase involved in cell wall biosynthesis